MLLCQRTQKGDYFPPHGGSGPGSFRIEVSDFNCWRHLLESPQGIAIGKEWSGHEEAGPSASVILPGNLVELNTPTVWAYRAVGEIITQIRASYWLT
jgi:hypothetical protein